MTTVLKQVIPRPMLFIQKITNTEGIGNKTSLSSLFI